VFTVEIKRRALRKPEKLDEKRKTKLRKVASVVAMKSNAMRTRTPRETAIPRR